MTDRCVSFAEINESLTRCMQEHPPQGDERKMHVDANLMSGLWSRMLLDRLEEVEAAGIKPAVLEAIDRWHPQV